mgnify:CR=1 FL=1
MTPRVIDGARGEGRVVQLVVDIEDMDLTPKLREIVGKFVSGIILGIGYIMAGFDRNKQGLHDRIAGTYVIKL